MDFWITTLILSDLVFRVELLSHQAIRVTNLIPKFKYSKGLGNFHTDFVVMRIAFDELNNNIHGEDYAKILMLTT